MQPAPPTELPAVSPPRRGKRRWPYIMLLLLILSVFIASWVLWPVAAPPLQIGRDTTYLSGPVNPDGTVNYVVAINQIASEGVTPENNAAVPILQALGPALIDPKVRQAVLAQLGVEPLPARGSCFVRLEDFVRTNRPDLLQHDKAGKVVAPAQNLVLIAGRILNGQAARLSPQDRLLVDAWLGANQEALDTLVQATGRTRFFIPVADAGSPRE